MLNRVLLKGFRTNRAMDELIKDFEKNNANDKQTILIVPEHYTQQGELDIIKGLKLKGLFNIQILSPKKMLSDLQALSISLDERLLNEAGEAVLLAKILKEKNDQLQNYRSISAKNNFSDDILQLLSSLKHLKMEVDDIDTYINQLNNPSEKSKWSDIKIIYSEYLDFLNNDHIANSEKQYKAAELILMCDYFENTDVYVYGFDMLVDSFAEVLTSIALKANKLELYLGLVPKESQDSDLYITMKQSLNFFEKKLANHNIKLDIEYVEKNLDSNEDIKHIDRCLFLNSKHLEKNNIEKIETKNIKLYNSNSLIKETRYIAAQAYILHNQHGIYYKDMLILLADADKKTYFNIKKELSKLQIPYFSNEKQDFLKYDVVQFLINVLRTIGNSDFQTLGYQDEFLLASINSCPVISVEEKGYLINFIKQYGYTSNRLLKTKKLNSEIKNSELLEQVLQKFLSAVKKIEVCFKETNSSDILKKLYEQLLSINQYDKQNKMQLQILKYGLLDSFQLHKQLWDNILEVFNQIKIIFPKEKLQPAKLGEYLNIAFNNTTAALLPVYEDSLEIAELDHYLSNRKKAVFILGLNDKDISDGNSIFTDLQIATLEKTLQKKIAINREAKMLFRKLKIKNALTLSKEHLIISYNSINFDNQILWPDSAIQSLKNMFRNLDIDKESEKIFICDTDEACRLFLHYQKQYIQSLKLKNSKHKKILDMLEALYLIIKNNNAFDKLQELNCIKKHEKHLDKQIAKKLFYRPSTSISKMESYARCKFKYYMDYAIKPFIIKEYGIDAIQKGNLYHELFEQIVPEVLNESDDLIIKDKLDDLILNKVNENNTNIDINDPIQRKQIDDISKRTHYHLKRAKKIIEHSKFKPRYFELEISKNSKVQPFNITLEDQNTIMVGGKIDRIDILDEDENKYFTVIDYKSSKKEFDFTNYYYGVQIQLPVYTKIVHESTEYKAFGFIYIGIVNPKGDTSNSNISSTIIDEKEIVEKFNFDACYSSAILSKSGDYNLSFYKRHIFNEEDFKLILDYAINKIKILSEDMLNGNIEADPFCTKYSKNENDDLVCKYCDYFQLCNIRTTNIKPKKIIESKEELLEKIKKVD